MTLILLANVHALNTCFGVIAKDRDRCRSSGCSPAEVAGKIAGKLSAADAWGKILLLGQLSKQL